jgi:hypothetical protein
MEKHRERWGEVLLPAGDHSLRGFSSGFYGWVLLRG